MTGNANSGGQNDKYKPEMADIARRLCTQFGATDQQVADILGVDRRTITHYKLKHEEFAEALRVGKAPADENVKKSLYMRAMGYDYYVEEIVVIKGEIHKVEVRKHLPPDGPACMYWMKNRDKENWNWDRNHKIIEADADTNTLVIEHSPDAD